MTGPQRFTVRHVSVYRYSEPVSFGEHRMMFRPRASHDLRLVTTQLRITPTPARLYWLHDVFDNSVAVATFAHPATELRFESEVTLEHFEAPLPDYSLLRAMTQAIKRDFMYVRRTEKGVQRPAETLYARSGSCRDFAVLMMDAVRSLGLAARFVSGYIFVPDHDTTRGGGATHAWLQIYLPGAGWVDFDPTNSIVGNRHLIRVAVAWDHQQALPLWGTWSGAPHSFNGLEVEVSVTEQC